MKMYNGVLKCANCSEVLNIARFVPEHDKIQVEKSVYKAGKDCPMGCKTLSPNPSENLNVKLVWLEIDPKRVTQ